MSVFTSPVLILGSAVMAFMTQLFLQLIIFSEVPMLPDNNNLNILQSHPRCGITTGGREECWWDCSRKLVNLGRYIFMVIRYYSLIIQKSFHSFISRNVETVLIHFQRQLIHRNVMEIISGPSMS